PLAGIADAEDLEDERNRAGEPGAVRAGVLVHGPSEGAGRRVRGEPEVAAHELAVRQPRSRAAMRRTMHLVHRDPPRATALDELEAQPALADPRLADHPHDLAVRRDRAREDPVEPGQLRFSADQAGEAPERRAVQARAARPDPAKLERPDLGAHALHAPPADTADPEEPLHQLRRAPGQQHGARS